MGKELKLTTDEIIEKYADMVYRTALQAVRNREDAQDVFQEVFMRLVRYRDRISSEEHLKAWLLRVTINCAKKQQGSFWKRKVFAAWQEEDCTPDENAEAVYEKIENADSPVVSAVDGLPERYRSVIYLFYYEGMSVCEIGNILGEKETTIKSRLHRAREILKIRLKGEDVL
ncbi:MAG: sigma-70 family RNA polymerase sigma factor [Lachnospiraceae bacterium]|nr:sigma-70 family RNA polymerase sigma factor [Lachnospiraceae bacterium]